MQPLLHHQIHLCCINMLRAPYAFAKLFLYAATYVLTCPISSLLYVQRASSRCEQHGCSHLAEWRQRRRQLPRRPGQRPDNEQRDGGGTDGAISGSAAPAAASRAASREGREPGLRADAAAGSLLVHGRRRDDDDEEHRCFITSLVTQTQQQQQHGGNVLSCSSIGVRSAQNGRRPATVSLRWTSSSAMHARKRGREKHIASLYCF
jgi:hypothetical protein